MSVTDFFDKMYSPKMKEQKLMALLERAKNLEVKHF